MDTDKHTQGEWRILHCLPAKPEYDGQTVPTVVDENNRNILNRGVVEEAANARLIVAAPVLLDTLTRIAHHATVGHGSLDVGDISAAHDDFALIAGVAQAAVAKARGE